MLTVASVGVRVQQFQTPLVEGLDIPGVEVDEAVESGLVGGAGELGVDAGDRLVGGREQAGEVLAEVSVLRLVGEQIPIVPEIFLDHLDHLGEVDDAGHG